MIRNILILTVIAALVPTAMSNVSISAGAEIALFSGVSDSDGLSISGNGDTANMELKATNENGNTKKVSDFLMNADNVLYIKTGDKVTVKDNVDFTKAITTDGNNNQKAIGITSNGVIDFTGYAQGVSTLDVVVDDDRAYGAIIVIGQQPPEVINKQVTKVNNNHEVDMVVKTVVNSNDKKKSPEPITPPVDPKPPEPIAPITDPNTEPVTDPNTEPVTDPNTEPKTGDPFEDIILPEESGNPTYYEGPFPSVGDNEEVLALDADFDEENQNYEDEPADNEPDTDESEGGDESEGESEGETSE
jgi:hypothetical protein